MESYNNIVSKCKEILEAANNLDEVGQFIKDEYKARLEPHIRTGKLYASPTYVVSDGLVTIGSDVEYAPFLEYGTSRMQARPCLRPAIDENHDRINEIISKKISEKI